MSRFSRVLWIGAGTLCVALGLVGILIPVLPTTPFLLLAAVCYGRSSPRFLHWLLTNRWFGAYIRNYREGRGLPRREKALTILALWLTIGVSAVYVVSHWWLRLALIAIALGVTIHLLWIKAAKLGRERADGERRHLFDRGAPLVDRSPELDGE